MKKVKIVNYVDDLISAVANEDGAALASLLDIENDETAHLANEIRKVLLLQPDCHALDTFFV